MDPPGFTSVVLLSHGQRQRHLGVQLCSTKVNTGSAHYHPDLTIVAYPIPLRAAGQSEESKRFQAFSLLTCGTGR